MLFASLRDEWEHLQQKYFTIILFCERAPLGGVGGGQKFLNSFIAQYNYVFQPKLTLALLNRIPSLRKGKMRSRTNRVSILAFPCVSRRDISAWKWALKPACLIQLWFTIVSKMVAETKTNLSPQTTSIHPSSLKTILSSSAPTVAFSSPGWFQTLLSLHSTSNIKKQTHMQWLACVHSGNTEIKRLSQITFK